MITATPVPSPTHIAARRSSGIDGGPLDSRMRLADRFALRVGLWLIQRAEHRVRRRAERGIVRPHSAVREATAREQYESLRQHAYTSMLYHG